MAYPIIVLHCGNQPYLADCLNQAKFSNPSSRVILLGDSSNKDVPGGIEHHHISEYYSEMSKELRLIYKHLSSNGRDYELFCILRWFVILDFILKNKIDKFLHVDSDCLLYANLENEFEFIKEVEKVEMAVPGYMGAWYVFFNQVKTLQNFCDFIMNKYRDKEFMQQLELKYHDYIINKKGGVCDMTLFELFLKSGIVSFLDISNEVGGLRVHQNISNSDGMIMNGNIQNIVFINNQPHSISTTGKLVRFTQLHFQGYAKTLMKDFTSYNGEFENGCPRYTISSLRYIYFGELHITYIPMPKDHLKQIDRSKKILEIGSIDSWNSAVDNVQQIGFCDYVAVNDVIEYVPDVLKFFADAQNFLADGSKLFLTVSNKLFSADRYRQPITFAEIYDIHKRGIQNNPVRALDYLLNTNQNGDLPSNAEAFDLAIQIYEQLKNSKEQAGISLNVFSPESFLLILYSMLKLRMFPFKILFFAAPSGHTDFACVLEKNISVLKPEMSNIEAENIQVALKDTNPTIFSPLAKVYD